MDETKLDESTLAAQRQEAERLRRVQEQQRLLRELQRQAAQERMQHKVMAMLQGNQFSKPGNIYIQFTNLNATTTTWTYVNIICLLVKYIIRLVI